MKTKAKQRSLDDWREIINRQSASGVSVAKFCKTEGISDPSFYEAKRRLGAAAETNRRGNGSAPVNRIKDFPMTRTPAKDRVELTFPNGCIISAPDSRCMADAIKSVAAVLA